MPVQRSQTSLHPSLTSHPSAARQRKINIRLLLLVLADEIRQQEPLRAKRRRIPA